MKQNTCSFGGHRKIFHDGIKEAVERETRHFVTNCGITNFMVGGMGEFDRVAEGVVRQLKHEYPSVKLYLVIPYWTISIHRDEQYYNQLYDEIIYPELKNRYYKAAISQRNRWMIEQSKALIAYVARDHGGAFDMLRYASRKGLLIRNVGPAK